MQIYDNRRRFERFTVITNGNAYRMSNDPSHVHGVNVWIGLATKRIVKRAGVPINFDDLNPKVQEAINVRRWSK